MHRHARARRRPPSTATAVLTATAIAIASGCGPTFNTDRINHLHNPANQKLAEDAQATFADPVGVLSATLDKNIAARQALEETVADVRNKVLDTAWAAYTTDVTWLELRARLLINLGIVPGDEAKAALVTLDNPGTTRAVTDAKNATSRDICDRYDSELDAQVALRQQKVRAATLVLVALSNAQTALVELAAKQADAYAREAEANDPTRPPDAPDSPPAPSPPGALPADTDVVKWVQKLVTQILGAYNDAERASQLATSASQLQHRLREAIANSRDPASIVALAPVAGTGLDPQSFEMLDHYLEFLADRLAQADLNADPPQPPGTHPPAVDEPDPGDSTWVRFTKNYRAARTALGLAANIVREEKRAAETVRSTAPADRPGLFQRSTITAAPAPAAAAANVAAIPFRANRRVVGGPASLAAENVLRSIPGGGQRLAVAAAMPTTDDRLLRRLAARRASSASANITSAAAARTVARLGTSPTVANSVTGRFARAADASGAGLPILLSLEIDDAQDRADRAAAALTQALARLAAARAGVATAAADRARHADDADLRRVGLDFLRSVLAGRPTLADALKKDAGNPPATQPAASDVAPAAADTPTGPVRPRDLEFIGGIVRDIATQNRHALSRVASFLKDLYTVTADFHREEFRHAQSVLAVAKYELDRWHLLGELNQQYERAYLTTGDVRGITPDGRPLFAGAADAWTIFGGDDVPATPTPWPPVVPNPPTPSDQDPGGRGTVTDRLHHPSVTPDSKVFPSIRALSATATAWRGQTVRTADPRGANLDLAEGRLLTAVRTVQGTLLMASLNARLGDENALRLSTELATHDAHLGDLDARAQEAGFRFSLGDLVAFHSTGIADEDIHAAESAVQSVLLYYIGYRAGK